MAAASVDPALSEPVRGAVLPAASRAGPGPASQPMTVRLCASADIAEGTSRGFPQWQVFVVRSPGGALNGWRDACPHYGDTPLAWRRDAYLNADASRIVCAAHGAQFVPDTGLCTLGPCLGQSLSRVPLAVTDDGQLEATLDSPTTSSPQETPP